MSVRNRFRGGKVSSWSWFQRYGCVVGWLQYFWNTGEAEHHGRGCEGRSALFTVAGKQGEEERMLVESSFFLLCLILDLSL